MTFNRFEFDVSFGMKCQMLFSRTQALVGTKLLVPGPVGTETAKAFYRDS